MAHNTISNNYFLWLAMVIFCTNSLAGNISKHPVILVVSYDGFRFDYLNRGVTPKLQELKASGVSVPYMIPTFPTKTFVNHQCIATGMYAETHGIVDNTLFDPLYNTTLSGYGDTDPRFWNYNPEVLPIWISNERAGDGRISGCYMWPGSSTGYGENNASLPTYYFPGYDGSVPWETRVDTVISWITNDTNPANLVFLYSDEPDTIAHAYSPNFQETFEQIVDSDERTTYLVDKLKEAGIFDSVNLIMLSDHGFDAVTKTTIINITAMIDPTLLRGMYGATPILQLAANDGKVDELFESLNNKKGFTIWKKEQVPHRYRYNHNRRIQDLVALADPGYGFDDFYANIQSYDETYNLTDGINRQYGVHGYTNDEVLMQAYFIAHGPAFRKGYEFEPIRNLDIVPLISEILHLKNVPNNGSLARVIEMIEYNTPTSTVAETH